jgi:hypothetical protein
MAFPGIPYELPPPPWHLDGGHLYGLDNGFEGVERILVDPTPVWISRQLDALAAKVYAGHELNHFDLGAAALIFDVLSGARRANGDYDTADIHEWREQLLRAFTPNLWQRLME